MPSPSSSGVRRLEEARKRNAKLGIKEPKMKSKIGK